MRMLWWRLCSWWSYVRCTHAYEIPAPPDSGEPRRPVDFVADVAQVLTRIDGIPRLTAICHFCGDVRTIHRLDVERLATVPATGDPS